MAQDQYSTPQKLYVAFSDTSFVTGDSPVTHDVNATLLRNGVDGFIDNFGAGDLQYQISEDGTTFGSTVYLPAGARDSVKAISIDSIKVTWVADTKYAIRMT